MNEEPMATYLQDQLSGALGAITILETLRDEHLNEPLSLFVRELKWKPTKRRSGGRWIP